jgi:hypothetical protein
VIINDEDIDRTANMSSLNQRGEEYNFKYTSEIPKFQVFKTDERPKNYSDFAEVSPQLIYSNYDSTSIMFYDRVFANKKYYYMFRTLSNYNLVSNPTAIYEVELLKDADDSKINISLVQTEEEKIDQGSIFLRRLMAIGPASQHTILDTDDESTYRDNLDNIGYGLAEDSIWGKKFKLRLKSKDSGKKIDFNVLFNLVKVNSTEDFS